MDLGIRSADDIIPEWQNLRVGDIVLWNREEGLPVLTLNPLRTLVMGGRMDRLTGRLVDLGTPKPDIYLDASWVFFLDDLAERTTRLIVRARFDWKPHTLIWMGVRLVLEPAHFVMERKTLLGIKRRAERLRVGRGHDPPSLLLRGLPLLNSDLGESRVSSLGGPPSSTEREALGA